MRRAEFLLQCHRNRVKISDARGSTSYHIIERVLSALRSDLFFVIVKVRCITISGALSVVGVAARRRLRRWWSWWRRWRPPPRRWWLRRLWRLLRSDLFFVIVKVRCITISGALSVVGVAARRRLRRWWSWWRRWRPPPRRWWLRRLWRLLSSSWRSLTKRACILRGSRRICLLLYTGLFFPCRGPS